MDRSTGPDSTTRWRAALADVERAIRTGEDVDPGSPGGPDDLGPMPLELRAHAQQLLDACSARIEAVQAEMDEIRDELGGLRRRSSTVGSWTDDAEGTTPGVGHLV